MSEHVPGHGGGDIADVTTAASDEGAPAQATSPPLPAGESGGFGSGRRRRVVLLTVASEIGATVHAYPRLGRAIRRVILRDIRDSGDTRLETAQIEDDGTLRIIGHDTGPRVSEFFGTAITSYEWVYVVAPPKVDALHRLLGGAEDDDALEALATYYQQHGGQFTELLRGPEIAAHFDNWHS
jgi:hypothetical protein